MSEAAGRRRGRDGQATRERIFREALRLFARKGFDATSIRDIASAVGVADAALYRHFSSKDDIASDIFTFHYVKLARAVAKIGAEAIDFSVILHRLTNLLCELFDNEPDVFSFILVNQHDHLRFVKNEDNVVVEMSLIMERAASKKEIDVVDPQLAAALALGAAIQPAVFCLYGRLPGPMRRYQDTIERSIAAALGAKRSPRNSIARPS